MFFCFLYTLFKVFFSQSKEETFLGHLVPTMVGPAGDTRVSEIAHLRFFETWQPCVITEDAISGNIINTISDHLGHFLILPAVDGKLYEWTL